MNTKHYFESIGAWPQRGGILRAYMMGFVLSVVLTLTAYDIVINHALPTPLLLAAVLALALVQMFVQVVYFLHLGHGKASKERLFALGAFVLIIVILVVGSIWVMAHLNDRMIMSPDQMEQYMQRQPGI
jgi:cytochrome o ubiquinol oxidase operon protein cyoD